MTYIENSIARIRAYIEALGLTDKQAARTAGLHGNTLRHLHDPGWNPRAETLKKLEAMIPADFGPPGV